MANIILENLIIEDPVATIVDLKTIDTTDHVTGVTCQCLEIGNCVFITPSSQEEDNIRWFNPAIPSLGQWFLQSINSFSQVVEKITENTTISYLTCKNSRTFLNTNIDGDIITLNVVGANIINPTALNGSATSIGLNAGDVFTLSLLDGNNILIS